MGCCGVCVAGVDCAMSCKGYVYVLSNPSMPGLVKIGMSSAGGHVRAKQLYQTGVPTPFVIEFQIYTSGYKEIEAELHSRLDSCRLDGREFFRVDVDDAVVEVLNVAAGNYSMTVSDGFFTMDDDQVEKFCTELNLNWLDVSGAINHLSDEAILNGINRYRAACEERKHKMRIAGGLPSVEGDEQ